MKGVTVTRSWTNPDGKSKFIIVYTNPIFNWLDGESQFQRGREWDLTFEKQRMQIVLTERVFLLVSLKFSESESV